MTTTADDNTQSASRPLKTFAITTAFERRGWRAVDDDDARRQHVEAFGSKSDEEIEWVEEIKCIDGPDGCAGIVAYWASRRRDSEWPRSKQRCSRHAEAQLEREREPTPRPASPTSGGTPGRLDPGHATETPEVR